MRFSEIIFELCKANNWRLIAKEIMPDHVHMFLEVDPTFAPSVIIMHSKRASFSPSQERVP